MSAGCPAVTYGVDGHRFQCVLRDDHATIEGPNRREAHDFGVEQRVYNRSLTANHDVEWLASEVRSLLTSIEGMRRDYAQDTTRVAHRRLVSRLIALAPANATRKTVPLDEVREAWQEAAG